MDPHDELAPIEDLIWLDDDDVLTRIESWWRLETEDSAIARLRDRPSRQALIGRGKASCDDVEIQLRLTQVVDGPYVLAVAMDTTFGNDIQVGVTSSHEALARLMGEVFEDWIFCGHDYEVAGTGALILPG